MADVITVRIEGIEGLRAKLNDRRADVPVERFLDRGAFFIQGRARSKAPVDTGRLKNSIAVESSRRERRIGPGVEYGEYVETGTRPHFPPPAALEGWARRHGAEAYTVARAISRRGTKAQPYMRPAAEEGEGFVKSQVPILAAELERAYSK